MCSVTTLFCIITSLPSAVPLNMASDLSILHACECSCVTVCEEIVERSSEIKELD